MSTREIFLALSMLGASVLPSYASPLQGASPVGCTVLTDAQGWSVYVRKPGAYCIGRDLKQSAPPQWLRLPHQPVPTEPLVQVRGTGQVKVDLTGHRLSTTMPIGFGIWHRSGARVQRTIAFFNGQVSTTIQPAVVMVHDWNSENKRFYMKKVGANTLMGPTLSDAHGEIGAYPVTEYILEDLTLTSDQVVIIMQGKGNIIRRCKIIGGNAAVNLYGPNLVFEDNEIIMDARDPTEAGGEPQVALYIEDGADSVIRNNRFVIRGRPVAATAVVLKYSDRVVLEGNTISGKATLFKKLDNRSSVEVK